MKRRTVGPAYERSPAERLTEWSSRNFLALVAAMVAAFLWWVIVDWTVNYLLNFLARGNQSGVEDAFNSEDPMWIIVKLIGSLCCVLLIIKSRTK